VSAWVSVLTLNDVPEQGFRAVKVGDTSILVGRAEGALFACVDRCPHAATPLRIGRLLGRELTCARHAWTFDVLTGHCVPENPPFHLVKLSTKVEGDQVFVELPEAQAESR